MRNYALQKGPCNFLNLRTSPWEIPFLLLSIFPLSLFFLSRAFLFPRRRFFWAAPPASLSLLGFRTGGASGRGVARLGRSARVAQARASARRERVRLQAAWSEASGGRAGTRGRLRRVGRVEAGNAGARRSAGARRAAGAVLAACGRKAGGARAGRTARAAPGSGGDERLAAA
jgi:hypothetical protein